MQKIQFGLSLPASPASGMTRGDYMEVVQKGLGLVSGHFDAAWFVDHLQSDNNPLLEGWTAINYLTPLYPQLRFGHIVMAQSFRNPALLAKMAATLQFMSGGRFILGIGAGWKEDEYRSYGYEFPSAGTRVEELDETLQIIKALWRDKQATFRGKHYQVVEAYCEPKPDPIPPVLIGGSKPRMLRLIARHADWWNLSWTSIANYRRLVEESERACAAVGRDAATLRRTWFGGCICAPTEQEVKALNPGSLSNEQGAIVGTPQQVIEQMREYIDLGVDYFILAWGGRTGRPNPITLELLVNEVLPALNRS
ncbi:MAG: LLM class flavin-dependent oxidoreductase [Ktedonobacteraceae bacterium]|nr:LLM class flavin-dependent oxidoreductase [Ktedonobacteraceae bacterium]